MVRKQSSVMWIQFSCIHKKRCCLYRHCIIMNYIDHYLKKKKVIEWTKEELGRKIMTKCVRLRANTWSYLKDCSENQKAQKSVS